MSKFKKASFPAMLCSLLDLYIATPSNMWTVDEENVVHTKKSESLTTRLLHSYGMDTITLRCDIATLAKTLAKSKKQREIEEKKLSSKLEDILERGFIYNKEKYNFFMLSPGDQRQAQMVFAKANSWLECEKVIKELTTLDGSAPGLDHYTAFAKEGKRNGLCQLSKLFARESATVAGSIPVRRMSEKAAEELNKCKIIYTEDIDGENRTPYVNPMDGKSGDVRSTVTTDGMWLYGKRIGLCLCLANGTIKPETFEKAIALLNESNKLKERLAHLVEAQDHKHATIVRSKIQDINCKLEDILDKANMPCFIQTRLPGSMKGAGHFADLDKYTVDNCDAVVFKSVRKFQDKNWNGRLGDLEICNMPHAGSGWVNISAPIISALVDARVDIMAPVVNYWLERVSKVFSNDTVESSKAIVDIMGAMSSHKAAEAENDEDERSLIVKALQTNVLLGRDRYMWSKVEDKIRAFVTRMAAGKLAVPGAYPYISVDPNHAIVKLIERGDLHGDVSSIPVLASGEYYYNNEQCRAIIARSPLTHPNQVKKINLVSKNEYKLYKNVLILNAIDGLWIDLAGADMDGDEVALIMETRLGEFPSETITEVINSIQFCEILNYEEGLSGELKPLTRKERIAYLVKNARRSQVGALNDLYSMWVELYCHLHNLLVEFDKHNCTKMVFAGSFNGNHFTVDGNTMNATSIHGVIPEGSYTRQDVFNKLSYMWSVIDKLEVLQSRAVDAPKTGVDVDPKEVENISIRVLSYSMIARKYSKGKYGDTAGDKAKREVAQAEAMKVANNGDDNIVAFRSYTPLGYITDTVSEWWNNHKESVSVYKKSYAGYLYALLTDREREELSMVYNVVGVYKNDYVNAMREIMTNSKLDETGKMIAKREASLDATKNLIEVAIGHGVSINSVAAAAYMHCYVKSSGVNKGNGYAWLLDMYANTDEVKSLVVCDFEYNRKGYLLPVFERGDMQYRYLYIKHNAGESVCDEAYTQDGILYLKHRFPIEQLNDFDKSERIALKTSLKFVDGQEVKLEYSNKGKLATFVRVAVEDAVNTHAVNLPLNDKKVAITVTRCDGREDFSEPFLSALENNNNIFDVVLNDEGRVVAMIDDNVIAFVNFTNADALSLVNKRVQMVHDDSIAKCTWTKYKTSITNLVVCEVGYAK